MTTAAPWPCAATSCTRTLRTHELETGQLLCDPCVRAMRQWLAELPNQLIVLSASVQREVTGDQGRGGTRHAPLPGRLDTLNLLGPAARETVRDPDGDQCGDLPLAATLGSWVRLVIEERRLNGPKRWDVLSLAAWLEPHLGWAAMQEGIAGELRDELHGMMRAIWGITRLRPRRRAIPRPCPNRACESLSLVEEDWSRYIECSACGGLWTQSELADDAATRLAESA